MHNAPYFKVVTFLSIRVLQCLCEFVYIVHVFVCEVYCRGESLTARGATGEAVCGLGDGCYQLRVVYIMPPVVCHICLLPSDCTRVSGCVTVCVCMHV